MRPSDQPHLRPFLQNKSTHTIELFNHFVDAFGQAGRVRLEPTRSMIAIDNGKRRVAWITQLGMNFIHVVFPFKQAYNDNFCFQKIAKVPGSDQFNHHFRMLFTEDVNEEVKTYMKIALNDRS
jgi:hypothetical protein